ncbi:MAG: DUF5787 family protein, partial [Salinirussus sp.]
AAHRDAVDSRKGENGRIEIRRQHPYPDWVNRVIAIENKPDLDASAARALRPQLERDVAMGLADEVWIATAATGDRVEPALLEDIPLEAGILLVDVTAGPHAAGDVAWHPQSLDPAATGTRILERPDGGTHDASAARFEYVEADWKTDKRLEIAERAYARGWRSYSDAMRTDCRHFELRGCEGFRLPHCAAKGRGQTADECTGGCPAFEPEPPRWRQQGWPITGGPGAAIERLLDTRRRRRRPGL